MKNQNITISRLSYLVNILILLLSWHLPMPAFSFTPTLFPGEELVKVNNYHVLIKYIHAKTQKPLIVFVPGDGHLARIAYGDPSTNPSDFLSYWIHEKQYPFLAVSYPMDNPLPEYAAPDFEISNWGELVGEQALQTIIKNNLSKHIVVVGWSMGGSIEQAVTHAALKRGIIVDAFIGLSAVPPVPEVMQQGAYAANKALPNGLADRRMLQEALLELVQQQNETNQHTIINTENYIKLYTGNTPVGLVANGLHYKDHKFYKDLAYTISDSGVYDFGHTPWIGLIVDDAANTAKISSIDPAAWNFLRMEMIYNTQLKGINLTKLPPEKWQQLRQLLQAIPQNLLLTVHGNHLFFIGEVGAKATADSIDELLKRIEKTKQSIKTIIQ